jgi:hypothetical protein
MPPFLAEFFNFLDLKVKFSTLMSNPSGLVRAKMPVKYNLSIRSVATREKLKAIHRSKSIKFV